MAETCVARCAHCDWAARLSDDSMLEAVTTLRQMLLDHVAADHPDRTGRIEFGTTADLADLLRRRTS